MSEISESCRGQWKDILLSLGVSQKYLTGKHVSCPLNGCGGTDRFRFTNKYDKGYYICSHCGGGDGVSFVMKYKGLDFSGAVKMLRPMVGLGEEELSPEVKAKIEEKKRNKAKALELWDSGKPISKSDPAGVYLTNRTGITEYPNSLRVVYDLPYFDGGVESGRYPALICYVSGSSGKMENVHRTYLTPSGEKASNLGGNARKMMKGLTITSGCAVRLYPVAGISVGHGSLIVAEGLETAISARELHGYIAAWALINADRMRAWSPPQGVWHVIVAGDNDASFTGQAAAYGLANRLKCQFQIEKVEVSIPLQEGQDWNDVWRGLRHI